MLAFGLRANTAGLCPVLSLPELYACSQSLHTPQPVLVLGIALTQVQQLALGLVEPHGVPMGLFLKLVQVPRMAACLLGVSLHH